MSERLVGTISRGIRGPIIRQGDDLAAIVTDSVLAAAASEGFALRDRDVVAVTESVVARSQGNYCTVDDIAADVRAKLGGGTVGVLWPILSRNRFAICLRGIAAGAKKIVLCLSYPSDEVGNHLIGVDELDASGINPYSDVLTLAQYREAFGYKTHQFTGVDYVEYYATLIEESGAEAEIIFANQAKAILAYTDCVITCDIHTRARTKRILAEAGAKVVCGLDDLMTAPVNGSGCNERYGLLGSGLEVRCPGGELSCPGLQLSRTSGDLLSSGLELSGTLGRIVHPGGVDGKTGDKPGHSVQLRFGSRHSLARRGVRTTDGGNDAFQHRSVVFRRQVRDWDPGSGELILGGGQQSGENLHAAVVQRDAAGAEGVKAAGKLGDALRKFLCPGREACRPCAQAVRTGFQLSSALGQALGAGGQTCGPGLQLCRPGLQAADSRAQRGDTGR